MRRCFYFFIFLLIVSIQISLANENLPIEVGIDEKLGKIVPLNLEFYDEQGYLVKLNDLITKPTLVVLVYFECPSICSPLLTEVTDVIKKVNLEPGKDYRILTISFDESEKPELAAKKRNNYLKLLGKDIPNDGWKFLTGDHSSIQAFTDAVGYKFKKKEEEFVHPAALIMLSPEGKITRYLYGTKFLPFDIKMAIIEAGEGKVGPTINRFLNYCFNYDPQGRTYALSITRIVGAGMLFLIACFVIFLVAKPKKKIQKGNQV